VLFIVASLVRGELDATTVLIGLGALFLQATGGFWYRAFTTRLVMKTRAGEPVSFRVLVRETFAGFPQVSTVGFLTWIGTIGGLLLFVVPGLIFAARRSPAISVAVVEGKSAFNGRRYRDPERSALRRSRDLVKGTGNSFEMFSIIAGKNAVYATLNRLIPVLFVFAVPWGSLAASIAYFELVDLEAGRSRPAGDAPGPAHRPSHDTAWRPVPQAPSDRAA